MPTFGSLFAGIGGLDLGLERAGWTCRWQVEIDPFCQRVLAKHWPAVARHGDITTFDLERAERVDLIAGGFPCQPVSIAGKGRAQGDARWLWPAFAGVIRVLRPRLVLVENVPGLRGRGLGDVLGDLAACGYDAEWDGLSASAVGAPHQRDRVWVVAYAEEFAQRSGLREGDTRGQRRGRSGDGGGAEDGAVAGSERLQGGVFARPAPAPVERSGHGSDPGWWSTEPDVGRVAYGVPSRVDRLRGLGNAVVPQVAEWIGRRLMDTL